VVSSLMVLLALLVSEPPGIFQATGVYASHLTGENTVAVQDATAASSPSWETSRPQDRGIDPDGRKWFRLGGEFGTAKYYDDAGLEKLRSTVVKRREWYLVSASWCSLCPAAKKKFLAKGWPEANVLTLDECQQRFGFKPTGVPYEFPEPTVVSPQLYQSIKATNAESSAIAHLRDTHGIDARGKTLEELEKIHDTAHGGSAHHFPGRPSMPTGMTAPKTTSQSNCPGGNCPVPVRQRWFFRRR